MAADRVADPVAPAAIIVGTQFQADALLQGFGRRLGDDVDDPVHGAGAIKRSGWPLQNLDPGGLFRVGIEQLVDVAEARCAQGNAI